MSILRTQALLILLLAACLRAAEPTAGLQAQTITEPDITYLKVGGVELKLDVYAPARQLGEEPWVRYSEARKPTLLYIHGGGWNSLSKAVRNLNLLPFLQRGWCVVNIDSRLLGQAPFPACIADCRQALDKARVKNRLLTVKGRKHGDFDEKELAGLYADIWKFLKGAGI